MAIRVKRPTSCLASFFPAESVFVSVWRFPHGFFYVFFLSTAFFDDIFIIPERIIRVKKTPQIPSNPTKLIIFAIGNIQ